MEVICVVFNLVEFIKEINFVIGFIVDMFCKEEEGCIGVLGVVSGFFDIRGFMMDFGGGSI